MKIYLVRHGETEMNIKKAYYGAIDADLTPKGRADALKVSRALKDICWNRVYASTKSRTIETARLICQDRMPMKGIFCLPQLSELNFGVFEGLTNRQVSQIYPQAYKDWCEDWLEFTPPGGECFFQFFNRVVQGFQQILSECEDLENNKASILICGHNGTLRVIMAYILGLGCDGSWHFDFVQDGWSMIEYACGNFTVRNINHR